MKAFADPVKCKNPMREDVARDIMAKIDPTVADSGRAKRRKRLAADLQAEVRRDITGKIEERLGLQRGAWDRQRKSICDMAADIIGGRRYGWPDEDSLSPNALWSLKALVQQRGGQGSDGAAELLEGMATKGEAGDHVTGQDGNVVAVDFSRDGLS